LNVPPVILVGATVSFISFTLALLAKVWP